MAKSKTEEADMDVLIADDRLQRIEEMLERLLKRQMEKAHYTVEEFAGLVNRRPFTVRQWCNLGRIKAEKSLTRTGACTVWAISHDEYLRFQREGLLPLHDGPAA